MGNAIKNIMKYLVLSFKVCSFKVFLRIIFQIAKKI